MAGNNVPLIPDSVPTSQIVALYNGLANAINKLEQTPFPTGPTGPSVTGPTGPSVTGPTGPYVTGPTGPSVTGPTGAPSTVTGPTGPASTVTGPTGPLPPDDAGTFLNPAVTGAPPGPTGPTGPSITGPTGPSVTGPTGSSATGPTGPSVTGPTGPSITGPTGPSVTGPTGPGVGVTGPTGPSVTGPTGAQGDSSVTLGLSSAQSYVTFTDDASRSKYSSVFVKIKEIKLTAAYAGSIMAWFDLQTDTPGNTVYGRVYVNGVARGAIHSDASGEQVSFSDAISGPFNTNDLIQVYVHYAAGHPATAYVSNFDLFFGWTIASIDGHALVTPLPVTDTTALSAVAQDP